MRSLSMLRLAARAPCRSGPVTSTLGVANTPDRATAGTGLPFTPQLNDAQPTLNSSSPAYLIVAGLLLAASVALLYRLLSLRHQHRLDREKHDQALDGHRKTTLSLLHDLEQARNKTTSLESLIADQLARIQQLQDQAENAEKDIAQLRQSIEQRDVDSSRLRNELQVARDANQALRESYRAALINLNKQKSSLALLDADRSNQMAIADDSAQQLVSLQTICAELDQERERLSQQLVQLQNDLERKRLEAEDLRDRVTTTETIEILRERLEAHERQHELVAAGLYPVSLDFGTPDELQGRLESIRTQLADMIRSRTAAVCTTKWSINGSTAEGTRATRHHIRIMLRTFNADADACLDLVRWNNLEKLESRLRASFEYVNQLGSTHATALQPDYLDARLEQLRLMHQYREAVHRRKEAMRAARQAAIEERRAAKEIEDARLAAEAEEIRYSRALEKARREIDALVGSERDKMLRTIAALEKSLEQASLQKQRAISMAQITKAGFVYVVSNIGSFGQDVLKIGMTRRIDPQERIRELGGASVPFHFDVHAMIYSENAPELENTFHRRFAKTRINLANGRKEFFRIPLSEVVEFSRTLSLQAEFSTVPEAKDYYISNYLRTSVLASLTDEELNDRINAMTDHPEDTAVDEEDSEDANHHWNGPHSTYRDA
jgi:hypothetical protein